jgi:hypothetical protein
VTLSGRSCNTEDIDHAPDEIAGYTSEHALGIGHFRDLAIANNWLFANFRPWNIVSLCAEYDVIVTATGGT